MTEILYKSKNIIVIHKPVGVPSQPDPSGDADALTLAAQTLSSLGEPADLYPVHRLDRVVSGLLVVARKRSAAAELSALISGEGIGKEYLAVIEGKLPDGTLEDYLAKNSRLGKAVVACASDREAKLARLECKTLAVADAGQGARSLVAVRLHTGRFHQIRAQLSSRGAPIVGDKKYGSRDCLCRTPALVSHKLDISLREERVAVSRLPDISEYPWSLFSDECYAADQNEKE